MSLRLPRTWDFNLRTEKIARSKSVMPGESSSGSGSPGSPSSTDRPLKTGWLKKQRSIVKNWQLRYFVLKGHCLYYYKDEKDTTCQGSIMLQTSQVNELTSNADEPGKFLFEIIPGGCGDRERDSHVLMANSQNEMEEWVKTIRRITGAPSSGAVFGKCLADTVQYEQKFGQHLVPILVEKCAEFIREHGLSEEGIFRLPGQDNQVKQFRDAFDAGERPSFPSDTDVHTVASLLKLYLRELPQPVVPWSQYDEFLECSVQLSNNPAQGREKLEKLISLLPKPNYNLLSYLCRFLYEIQLNSRVNKMSVENLATVIGVNLLKPRIEDPVAIMKGTPQIQKLMTVLISLHKELFPKSKDMAPSPPPQKSDSKKSNIPRSSVGWDVAEGPSVYSSKDDTNDSLSESSDDVTTGVSEGDGEDSEEAQHFSSSLVASDPWTGSPRKRTQTLPSRRCPFSGEGSEKGGNGKRPGLFQGDLWGAAGTSPPEYDADKRTLSEDIFKILDLHRVSLFRRSEENGGKHVEEASSAGTDAAAKQTEAQVDKPSSKPLLQPREVMCSTVKGDKRRETDKGQEATAQSPQMETPKNNNNKEQQQQVSEDLITSLQRRNSELQGMVSELREALQAEQRRNAALEILHRNADRAREQAEKRNQALDREIQQFLSGKTSAGPQ
ncbi:rho GTPase-activating protein 25 [Amia ocellicauda]|uniref:rho GTPase-activating protein 25 n=1 Tax=Amia ocellicauda TaxID=2972642 RepID=UPI00346495EA